MKKIFILFILLVLTSCIQSKDWDAFVYPNGTMIESTWKIQKWFSSLEECRKWALSNLWNSSEADYECWYKCRAWSMWLNICKKTER